MVANNKDDFLFQLHNELHRIGIDANEEIFADFEEHFKASASEGLTEEETCRRLGDVKEIARSYIEIESSKINSIVAHAIEADRPHVSLTKPGRDVPADLSLVKDDEEQPAPVREFTPEHIAEEVVSSSISLAKEQNEQPVREVTPEHIAEEGVPESVKANSEQTEQPKMGEPTVAEAFSAAGHAAVDAAKSAGKAVADAFSSDAMKSAGKSAAEAVKNAGHAVAETISQVVKENESKTSDNNTSDWSGEHRGDVPLTEPAKKIDDKGFDFKSLKDFRPNVNAGKLITCILLDLFLWSWLISMLVGIVGGIFGAFGGVLSAGFGVLFGANFFFISRLFLAIGLISLALIILGLGILLIKGIIAIIKHIVIMHVKAIYDL